MAGNNIPLSHGLGKILVKAKMDALFVSETFQ
jgi:hypothetical protein